MAPYRPDMIQGTLDMLILKVLDEGALHGWGIGEQIQAISDDVLQVNQGSLYPALHRLTREGWVETDWRVTENNRRAKYYRLTGRGQAALADEREHWLRLSGAVNRVLGTT